MNTTKEIVDLVSGIIKVEIDDNAGMGSVPEWDSIHNIIILNEVQAHFNIVIPDDDVFDLVSIKDIAAEVERLRS